VLRNQRGDILMAPSSLTVSPFNIGFSMMWAASIANSGGRCKGGGQEVGGMTSESAPPALPRSTGVRLASITSGEITCAASDTRVYFVKYETMVHFLRNSLRLQGYLS
jgi:hypothetical protein